MRFWSLLLLGLLLFSLVTPPLGQAQYAAPLVIIMTPGEDEQAQNGELTVLIAVRNRGIPIDPATLKVTVQLGGAQFPLSDLTPGMRLLAVRGNETLFGGRFTEGSDLPAGDLALEVSIKDRGGAISGPTFRRFILALPPDVTEGIRQRTPYPFESQFGPDLSFTQARTFLESSGFVQPDTGVPWYKAVLLPAALGKDDWLPLSAPFADKVAELRKVIAQLEWRSWPVRLPLEQYSLTSFGVFSSTVPNPSYSTMITSTRATVANQARNKALSASHAVAPFVSVNVLNVLDGLSGGEFASWFGCSGNCTLVEYGYTVRETMTRLSPSSLDPAFPVTGARLVIPNIIVPATSPLYGAPGTTPDFKLNIFASRAVTQTWPPTVGTWNLPHEGEVTISGAAPTYTQTLWMPLDPTLLTPDPANPTDFTDRPLYLQFQHLHPTSPCAPFCTTPDGLGNYYMSDFGIQSDVPLVLYRQAFQPVVIVEGIEAVQVTQNLANDTTLIAKKPTAVRALLRSGPTATTDFSARLFARRGNQPLGPVEVYQKSQSGGDIDVQPVIDRGSVQVENALFEIPKDWADGTVELEVRGVNTPIACGSKLARTADGGCATTVQFVPSVVPKIELVPFSWFDESGARHEPNVDDLMRLERALTFMLPVAAISVTRGAKVILDPPAPGVSSRPLSEEAFVTQLTKLEERRESECANTNRCPDWVLGMLAFAPLPAGGSLLGRAYESGRRVAIGYLLPEELLAQRTVYQPWFSTLVHELGHLLVREHVKCASPPNVEAQTPGYVDNYPYAFGVLGGSDNGRLDHWGLDLATLRMISTVYEQPVGRRTVYRPTATGDTMSYCPDVWPSDWTYEAWLDALKFRDSLRPRRAPAAVNRLVVSGLVNPGSGAGTLFPAVAMDMEDVVLPPVGPYALRIERADGIVLTTIPFSIPEPFDAGVRGFTIQLPNVASTARIVLLKDGKELASLRSNSQPTVSLNAIGGVSGGVIPVRWSATGENLRFQVQYSHDGGSTWQIVGQRLTGTLFDLPIGSLPGGTNAMVEVQVTDGVRTATARSGSFAVPRQGPRATIEQPGDGRRYVDGQQIFLTGSATDAVDGSLSGSALAWSSDRVGPLGTGGAITIDAATLPTGLHHITLSATNGAGISGSDSITIEIGRTAVDFPPALLVESPALSVNVLAGFDTTVTRRLSIGASGSLSTTVHSLAPWLTVVQVPGRSAYELRIDVTALPRGTITGAVRVTGDPAGPRDIPVIVTVEQLVIPVPVYIPRAAIP